MKAIVCTKYGTPEVLQLKDVKKPVPEENEALIKVCSSTVTAGDCRIIKFDFPKWFWLPGKFTFGFTKPRKNIPGWELAGKIEEIGDNVKNFNAGDYVFGYNKGISFGGTNAEYKCLPSDRLVKFNPNTLNCNDAAVLPIGGLTALHFLRKANTSKGKKVLILGASGSVGTFAVQLAKHFGAEVTGVCSTRNIELVKSIGADKVFDYTKEEFTENGNEYDTIFDTVCKYRFSNCKKSLTRNGTYVTLDWPFLQAIWTKIFGNKQIIFGMAPDKIEDLIYLKNLAESGIIKPVIDNTYLLEDAVEAYRYTSSGRKTGNVILQIN